MKSLKAKIIVLLIVITMAIPFGSVLAANEGIQLIQTTDGNIVVYVEGLENEAFDYALSTDANASEMDLNYINSVQDEEGNQVALITPEDLAGYLYIRKSDNTVTTVQLDVDVNNMFTQEKMNLVETTTKRISTETVEELSSNVETINDIEYTYVLGGLKITDDQNSTYSYQIVKLPNEKYSELQNLANELNSDYESKTMYSKIEFANRFYNLYNELIGNVNWQPVENMEILQPEDFGQDEQYVVMLRKVAEDGTTTYDAKFMTSYHRDLEEVVPASTEQVTTQETSKLPITGDSIILFVLLAALVIIAIIVYIRMRKLNKKADK